MNTKKTLIYLTTTGLLSSIPALTQAEDFFTDLVNVVAENPNPFFVTRFLERRINEWSIGVFSPDYVKTYPAVDYQNKSKNHEFKQVVSFGDSISDKGAHTRSTLFLPGGFNASLYNDYLSEIYSGKPSIPYTLGGVNYAESGSTFERRSFNFQYVRYQIDRYIKRFGEANPENLYLISAGSMDIGSSFDKLIFNLFSGRYHLNDREYTLDHSPQIAAQDVAYLHQKGAKYILVSNLPDGSLTPYTAMLPIASLVRLLNYLFIPDFGLATYIGQGIDHRLRNPANQIQAENIQDYIRLNGIHTMQSIFWFLPHALVTNLFDFLSDAERQTTRQFSYSLNRELEKTAQDVVLVDIRGFFKEVFNDYRSYGFDEILVPMCDLGFSSRYCDSDSPHYHNDKVYFFGDWVHPSPAAHFLLYQYARSIFDAPLYVSSLSDHYSDVMSAKNNFLDGQITNFQKNDTLPLNKWRWLGGYSGLINSNRYQVQQLKGKTNLVNTLNVGTYSLITPNLTIGLLLSGSLGTRKPYNNYRFQFTSLSADLFSHWINDRGYWINTNLSLGLMHFDHIERSIPLMKMTRIEKVASTKAIGLGIYGKAGYNWLSTNNLIVGPQIALNMQKVMVKNMKEDGNRSTAMHFYNHHKNDFSASIGGYLQTKNYHIGYARAKISAEILYGHAFSSKSTKVRGAINSTLTSFIRESIHPKKWVSAQLTGDFSISPQTSIISQFNFKIDDHHNNQFGCSVAYQQKL